MSTTTVIAVHVDHEAVTDSGQTLNSLRILCHHRCLTL